MTEARLDGRLMRQALAMAAAADLRASPNPTVGAVLSTPTGRVIAGAASTPVGGPHAEVVALEAAGVLARGATLHVTLEPCAHHGRTPPCVEALIAAGVGRVVAATIDPDRRVMGRGFRRLREAGIEVVTGVEEDAARRLHRVFIHWATTGRPFVTLKFAASLDGRVATAGGQSRWISSSGSRRLGHVLRHRHDAILVGSGTVLSDDPELSARLDGAVEGRQPLRVVVDSRLRTPPDARLLGPGAAVVIATIAGADPARAAALEAAGATVLRIPERGGHVDLAALLDELGRGDVSSVLVEGGPTIHGELRDRGLADAVVAFLAPRLIGGSGAPGAVGGVGSPSLADAPGLDEVVVTMVDGDVVVSGLLRGEAVAS